MQKLLADRHVTIVCGDGVFDKLQYKAYDVCKSVEFVTAPSMNAFAEYDRLLHDVLKINKNDWCALCSGQPRKCLPAICTKRDIKHGIWGITSRTTMHT